MKSRITASISFVSALYLLLAHMAEAAPRETLRNLGGCFQVSYRFVKDGGPHDYHLTQLMGKPIYEWISTDEKESGFYFQHYSIFGYDAADPSKARAMRHWSEEWTEMSEGWNQKVFNIDGKELRYECTASFESNQWSCYAGPASKPRRDKDRKDYELLDRENTLQITPIGWIQVEKNKKLNSRGEAVSAEVGWVEYSRVDPVICKSAQELE